MGNKNFGIALASNVEVLRSQNICFLFVLIVLENFELMCLHLLYLSRVVSITTTNTSITFVGTITS